MSLFFSHARTRVLLNIITKHPRCLKLVFPVWNVGYYTLKTRPTVTCLTHSKKEYYIDQSFVKKLTMEVIDHATACCDAVNVADQLKVHERVRRCHYGWLTRSVSARFMCYDWLLFGDQRDEGRNLRKKHSSFQIRLDSARSLSKKLRPVPVFSFGAVSACWRINENSNTDISNCKNVFPSICRGNNYLFLKRPTIVPCNASSI